MAHLLTSPLASGTVTGQADFTRTDAHQPWLGRIPAQRPLLNFNLFGGSVNRNIRQHRNIGQRNLAQPSLQTGSDMQTFLMGPATDRFLGIKLRRFLPGQSGCLAYTVAGGVPQHRIPRKGFSFTMARTGPLLADQRTSAGPRWTDQDDFGITDGSCNLTLRDEHSANYYAVVRLLSRHGLQCPGRLSGYI